MNNKPETRLIVNSSGGLGNQMFQYAAGLYFSRVLNRKLECVKPRAARQQWHGYSRPHQLDLFRIEALVRRASPPERLLLSANWKLAKWRGFQTLLNVEILREPVAYRFHPHLQRDPSTDDSYLDGYWQAAAYVEAVASDLRRHFRLRNSLQARNQEYANQILRLLCPVSLHIRMGDFTLISHPSGGHGSRVSHVLPVDYYKRAIAAVEEAFEDPMLVIFSDEPDEARRLFRGMKRCIFIEGNNAAGAHEDLTLMSMCKHHVIANSSFSWWGAWLNRSPQKRVFAPRYWGNTEDSYFPDLYPEGWTTISNLPPESSAHGGHEPWPEPRLALSR
jgi:hypothetical protein